MKSFLFWILALLFTLSSAIYQRMTGPTHPTSGSVKLNNEEVQYYFYRTQGGTVDHFVSVENMNTTISGILFWKRY